MKRKSSNFDPQRKYVKSESDILYTDIANSSYLATATRLLEEFFKCFPRIKKSNPNAWASFHNNISHLKVSSLSPFSYWNGVSSLINCWTFVCSLHSTINVKDKVSIRLKLPLRRTAVTDGCPKVWIIRNWSFGCCCWLYACNGCGLIDDFRVFFYWRMESIPFFTGITKTWIFFASFCDQSGPECPPSLILTSWSAKFLSLIADKSVNHFLNFSIVHLLELILKV